MARFRLRRPDQPWWIRVGLALYEWAASLRVAVVLICVGAAVLGWATFVEKWYGSEAVSFGIYRSWWFAVLLGLLGLNVLCATLIRFPWKRYQTGFVITHLGILALLLGCWVQWVWGIQGVMVIYEGEASSKVFVDEKLFRLKISSLGRSEEEEGGVAQAREPEEQTIEIPFRSGPFHWGDYERMSFFPWRIVPRDRGRIYQQDGMILEVLDYYADSERVVVPRLGLEVALVGAGGAREEKVERPSRLTLMVVPVQGREGVDRPWGIGDWQNTPWGPPVVFWMVGSEAERRAFLETGPVGRVGQQGQVVLWHQGEVFHFSVEELQQGPERSLGVKGTKIHFLRHEPRSQTVDLEVRAEGKPAERMFLFAQNPSHNRHADGLGVYGSYWVEPPEVPASLAGVERVQLLRLAAALRVDIVLGPDGRLYYRQWEAPRVTAAGPWPLGSLPAAAGTTDVSEPSLAQSKPAQNSGSTGVGEHFPKDSGSARNGAGLRVFAGTPLAMEMRIVEFRPAEKPKVLVEPKELDQPGRAGSRQPQAKIRLTVDGNEGEFWVPLGGPRLTDVPAVVSSRSRRVEVLLLQRTVELGIKIYLHDFKRKVEPGSPHEAHYSSLVDVLEEVESGARPKVLQEKVLITMNQPLSAKDPKTGRWYRFYQDAFGYIGKPGDPEFDKWFERHGVLRGASDREESFSLPVSSEGVVRAPEDLYYSRLSVNYDPGRGLKYAGSALIVMGIAVMYLMRAYIFAPRAARGTSAETAENPIDRAETRSQTSTQQ